MALTKEEKKKQYNISKKIFLHFSEAKNTAPLRADELRDNLLNNAEFMVEELQQTRFGGLLDEKGVRIKPRNVSLSQALYEMYGIKDIKDSEGKVELSARDQYLRALGIYKDDMSLSDMAVHFGMDILNKQGLDKMLLEHGQYAGGNQFAAPRSTADVPSDFRFLIPELIMDAIRTNYLHQSLHTNWIASTRNIDKLKVTMPQIRQALAMPARIFEGATVPFGTVSYGQKDVTVYKIGIGLELTEELIIQSAISDLFVFLQDVGSLMSIGADNEALTVLIDGDQADGSESAPVIGVNDTTPGIDRPDLVRIPTRMNRLKLTPNRIITSEEVSMKNIEEASTTGNYVTPLEFLNKKENFSEDVYAVPANRMIFVNAGMAMSKLQFGSLRTRRETDIDTGKERTVITDFIGFAKIKRDAAVILDGSVAYSATVGQAGAWPAYMDIDSHLAQTFEE